MILTKVSYIVIIFLDIYIYIYSQTHSDPGDDEILDLTEPNNNKNPRVNWQGIWIKVESEAEYQKIRAWEKKKYTHILRNKFGVDTITDLTDNALKEMSVEDFFYCFNRVGIFDPVFFYLDSGTNEIVSYIQSQDMKVSIMMEALDRNIQITPFTNSVGIMMDGWMNDIEEEDDDEDMADQKPKKDLENKHDG